jgi:8-oxo-dGTP pyrophosphatase MutT (NUDIX family)
MEIVKTHVGVYGIIVKNNKLALIRKARGGYKGKLDLPGGGIEHIETPEQTLKRELLEEIGAEVLTYELFDVTATNIKWKMEKEVWEDLHHIGILYKVDVLEDYVKHEADGIDSNGCSFYKISELDVNQLTPFTIDGLKKLGYKI